MSTPGKRFDYLLKMAADQKREINTLKKQQKIHDGRVSEYENMALEIIEEAVGYAEQDVVIDEFGSMFRVTNISLPRLYWSALSDPPGYMKTLGRVRVEGLLLNQDGTPRWTKPRYLHGKLMKYEPETI